MARMLIRSYLSRRTTKTKVGHAISDYITLDRGIGKGSVIGPMFFICILIDFSVLEAKGVIDLKKVDVATLIMSLLWWLQIQKMKLELTSCPRTSSSTSPPEDSA